MFNPFFTCTKTRTAKKKGHFFEMRRSALKTDSSFGKATPLLEKIKKKTSIELLDPINKGHCLVTQNFIGQALQGGGPNYTTSLLAEASELATSEAKILHPTILAQAIRRYISVFVASCKQHKKGGTWIKKSKKNAPLIRALTLKKGLAIVTLKNPSMVNDYGFLAKIFSVFETHKISVDTITTSEISVAMTVDLKPLKQQELVSDLQKLRTVEIEKGQKQIKARPFCLNAINHHFCFLMKSHQVPEAISKLHEVFNRNPLNHQQDNLYEPTQKNR